MIIPGSEGEYGVTVGHSPIVSELKPGVLQVLHGEASNVNVHCLMTGLYDFVSNEAPSFSGVEAFDAFSLLRTPWPAP